jgi:hypothetical protein
MGNELFLRQFIRPQIVMRKGDRWAQTQLAVMDGYLIPGELITVDGCQYQAFALSDKGQKVVDIANDCRDDE